MYMYSYIKIYADVGINEFKELFSRRVALAQDVFYTIHLFTFLSFLLNFVNNNELNKINKKSNIVRCSLFSIRKIDQSN